ncbi:hypothetical protein [Clostridium polynesiense]|uniref:hypothetical protein n=1 Tax=Clostridium polynesiense TaxID=1325933 RepID=UPI00058BFD10|nr:hypothetical protein [Clostridium polynesiense]
MKLLKHLGMSLLLLFLGTSTFLSIIFFLNLKRLIIAYIIFGTAILVITILLIRRMTFKNKRFLIFYGKWGTASIIITSLFLLINSTILVFLGIAAIQLQSPDLKASLQSNISIYSFYNTTKSKKYSDKVFNKEQYNNVNLYYLKDIEHGIPLVKHYLDNIQEDCESILIPVNLRNLNFKLEFNEEEYNSLSTLYKEYKGIYISSKFNNQISMIAVDAYEDILGFNFKSSAFKDTLRHEYTHYYLDMFFKDNNSTLNAIPVWFNEGVAEYISMVSPIFSEGFPKKIIPFNKLYTDEEWSRAIEEGEDIYLQSHFAIFNLSDLKGVDIIKRILKSTL